MKSTTFYHVSPRQLTENTTLTIGVYGERIRQETFIESNYACYIKEEIFEAIRLQHYSDLPSRFNCVFLFSSIDTAKESYANKGRYQYFVYEVELIEGKPLKVEMDLLRCDRMSYEEITTCAHKYWKQYKHPNSATVEILLNGQAKVKKLLLAPSNVWDL